VVEGVDPLVDPLLVRVDQQIEVVLAAVPVPELDHLSELPGGVDVQQREGELARVERLAGQVHHHRGVLADRVEHHRVVELGGDLADDVDALGFELLEVAQAGRADEFRHGARTAR